MMRGLIVREPYDEGLCDEWNKSPWLRAGTTCLPRSPEASQTGGRVSLFIFLTSTYVQPYGYERPLVSSSPFIFAQVK